MFRRFGLWIALCSIAMVQPAAISNLLGQTHADQPTQAPASSIVSLSAKIDQAIEAAAIGPLARQCSDGDFLRRISLDLTGIVPTTEQVEQFLADPSIDKRSKIVDQLLDSPQFDRWMTVQFSVMLLERRSEKNVKQQQWEQYLFEAIASNKPLDQWMGELIVGGAYDNSLHPSARFLLSREVEPNAVTRDVGRLVFGMDLQCAQCHNHPLIDAYHQDDYYGLYAFLHRTALFTNPTTKEVRLSEKADGEASFRSVFTGSSRDHMPPRLPKEWSLFDESPDANDYAVQPDKNSAGQPRFSRREALARQLSASHQFRRNMANRIWALMFARGLVHPLDIHHVGNAASHPQLLTMLADELKEQSFQLRPLLHAIALSKAYQRSCEAPPADMINFEDIAARLNVLTPLLANQQSKIDSLKSAAEVAEKAYNDLSVRNSNAIVEAIKLIKPRDEARQERTKQQTEYDKLAATVSQQAAQVAALNEAVDKLKAAVATIPDDKVLADSLAKISDKAKKLSDAWMPKDKQLAGIKTKLQAATAELDKRQVRLDEALKLRVSIEELKSIELAHLKASAELTRALDEIQMLERQISLCKLLVDYRTAQTDPAKAASMWQSIIEAWTVSGQLAPLKPLTPEQLVLSAMQSTGTLTAQQKKLRDQIAKADADRTKEKAANASKQDKAKTDTKSGGNEKSKGDSTTTVLTSSGARHQTVEARLELQLLDALRDKLDQFATLYGGLPGEDFQATVNQALFFGNGSLVDGLVKPGGGNLAATLVALQSPEEIADKMFLAVLSRRATESERNDLKISLSQRADQRSQVISEWIWALLASNEFRFNH